MSSDFLTQIERELNCGLDTRGALELLRRSRRALLVSRGERAPKPRAPELLAALEAARECAGRGDVLVCGAGRVVWDAALLACRDAGGAAVVVLTHAPDEAELTSLREFIPREHLLIWPRAGSMKKASSDALLLRDRLVGRLADSAVAVQVRKNGNMAAVRAEMLARGCGVENKGGWKAAPPRRRASQPGLLPLKGGGGSAGARLTHFTRAPEGAWPGETHANYLRWLCSGAAGERGDFEALRRILTERKIRACGRLICGKVPMVCFTAAEPDELLRRKSWRKGLRHWTVSPYALSFPAQVLERRGAQAVRYIDAGVRDFEDEPCFTQPQKSAGQDWTFEAEWRLRGDFDFSELEPKAIVALVSEPFEAEILAREFGVDCELI